MAKDLSRATGVIPAEMLLQVPGWTSSGGAAPVPLQSGAHNHAFRVTTSSGAFVLRLQSTEAPSLGADRTREAALHAAAASHGLAPAMVYADPNGRCIVTEFASGELWTPDRMTEPASMARLSDTLRALHSIVPPAVQPFDLMALLRRHCDRLAAANPAEQQRLERIVMNCAHQLDAIGSSARPAAIVHNDLHHSNIIDAGQLVLIDWEYAAVADPVFDPACLLAYYPATQKMAAMLIERAGLAGSVSVEMLRTAADLFGTLSDLWAQVGKLAPAPAN